jgi:hypothetical protein
LKKMGGNCCCPENPGANCEIQKESSSIHAQNSKPTPGIEGNLPPSHAPPAHQAKLTEVFDQQHFFRVIEAAMHRSTTNHPTDHYPFPARFTLSDITEGELLGPYFYPATDANYYGGYLNGKRHGPGLHRDTNSGLFRGNFLDDFQNGPGIYLTLDGCSCKATWKNNEIDGKVL